MKRGATVLAAVVTALLISVFATGGPITGGGLTRVVHGSAFYGLGTTGVPLDLRHDCSSGSGLAWDGSAWACAVMGGGGSGGSGFTIAGNGLVGSGSTIKMDGTGCSTGWVPTWNGTVFACAAVATGLGSGSITISAGSATSPIALGTLGTTDWIDSLATTTHAGKSINCDPSASVTTCWEKQTGGGLLTNFDWFGIAAATPNGSVAGVLTFTAGSADSMTSTALSSNNTATTNSTTSGQGLRWMLPSIGGNVQRVARLYLYQYDNTVTCAATAMDGTAAGSSATVNTGSGGILAVNAWTVTYKTNYAVPVTVICTITSVNTGAGTPAFGWSAASLGST